MGILVILGIIILAVLFPIRHQAAEVIFTIVADLVRVAQTIILKARLP